MAHQFALAHLSALHVSPPEFIELAARTGYDAVGLRLIPVGAPDEPLYPLDTDRTLFVRTRAALRATELKLCDIEVARIVPMAKPRDYLPALEAAAELGGRHVLSSAWYNDPPFIVDFFAELCDLAAPLDLTVDFEFVTWSAVRNLDAAVNIVRAADRPNGGLLIDALHFDRAHTDPASLASLPRHWFRFVQLCDGPAVYVPTVTEMIRIGRIARLYLGEGGIDCAAILRELPPVMVSLEIPNAERVASFGAEEHARRVLESAKIYCAAHAPDAAA